MMIQGHTSSSRENCGCTCGDAMTMMVFEEATYDYCEFLDKKGIDVTGFVTKAEAAVFHELATSVSDGWSV